MRCSAVGSAERGDADNFQLQKAEQKEYGRIIALFSLCQERYNEVKILFLDLQDPGFLV